MSGAGRAFWAEATALCKGPERRENEINARHRKAMWLEGGGDCGR